MCRDDELWVRTLSNTTKLALEKWKRTGSWWFYVSVLLRVSVDVTVWRLDVYRAIFDKHQPSLTRSCTNWTPNGIVNESYPISPSALHHRRQDLLQVISDRDSWCHSFKTWPPSELWHWLLEISSFEMPLFQVPHPRHSKCICTRLHSLLDITKKYRIWWILRVYVTMSLHVYDLPRKTLIMADSFTIV